MKQFGFYIDLGLILTLFLGTPAGLTWAEEQKMTLEQCLKTGMEKNPSLKASRFDVDISAHGIKQARADFLPSVSSSYSMASIRSINSKYRLGINKNANFRHVGTAILFDSKAIS